MPTHLKPLRQLQ